MPKVRSPPSYREFPVKCVRKGFLMNDDSEVSDVSGVGLAEDGAGYTYDGQPDSYAGLNGGGFFELPGCVNTYALGGTCGRREHASWHGEGGDHGAHFVTGAGRGVANVLIENIRLNDVTDQAGHSAFWSAMAPDGSAHRNVTLRKVVAMRTMRDGINVHGHVIGWLGEDLHFENCGDDVYAVWGAGGGSDVYQTGFPEPYVRCGLTNSPATNVTYRNTFAKPGGSWSSCSHIFGAGTVLLEHMLCCHTPQQAYQYPALSIDSTFCPSYTHANVTFRGLRWFDDAHVDLCDVNGPGVATAPVSPRAEAGGPTGWKASDLHVRELGCQVPQE